MDLIKNFSKTVEFEQQFETSLLEQAEQVDFEFPVARLGLTEAVGATNTQVKKGDLIVDPQDKTVYVATGASTADGKPIVMNNSKKKALEPEFIVVGAHAKTPVVRRVAMKMAADPRYASRRVLVYGDAAPTMPQDPTINIGEGSNNPVANDKLPAKDPGIPAKFGAAWGKKDKKETTTGSDVKNDKEPFVTWMKKSGNAKPKCVGDCDPGNEAKSK